MVMAPFQLLSNPRKITVVNTYDTDLDQMRITWNCVPLEIRDVHAADPPEFFEAFKVADSKEVDLVALVGANPAARRSFKIWEYDIADVEGCFILKNPRPAKPCSTVQSKSSPLLGLHDTLNEMGYIMVDRPFKHSADAGLFYDKADRLKRAYLQCVISSQWLYANGQLSFDIRQLVAYYVLILKTPGMVEAGRPAREYIKQLTTLDPAAAKSVVNDARVSGPKRQRVAAAASDVSGDEEADDEHDADCSGDSGGSGSGSGSGSSSSSSSSSDSISDSSKSDSNAESVSGGSDS